MSLSPETMVEISGAEASRELIAKLTDYRTRTAGKTLPGYLRLAAKIRRIDLLDWLESQEVVAKYYWHDRDNGVEFAGLLLPRFGLDIPTVTTGILRYGIDQGESEPLLPNTALIRGFNSFPFAEGVRLEPEPRLALTPHTFLVPDIELVAVHGETWLTCILQHASESGLIQEGLTGLVWDEDTSASSLHLVTREETQSRLQWAVAVNRAVAAIERGELEKVVLARRSTCRFTDAVNPWKLLKRLRDANPHTYLFGIDRKPYDPFIGASPEQLYRRIGRQIETEAVAGTRPRGVSPEQDSRYRDDLLHSSKDRREHELVVTGIAESLKPLIEQITIQPEPTIVPLTNVQHLVIKIQATLKPGITDDDLLRALQPSPAVGGYPKQRAIDLIHALEPFTRGSYAGPIGWVSGDSAEFAVGIRSATIKENALTLYAGAGIVEGSDPDAEWDEIDQKFNTFTSILTDQ